MKIKVFAPVNVALIKYWGKENAELRIPANSSLSICLAKLGTTTEVELVSDLSEDEVVIDGKVTEGRKKKRVVNQLDRVRELAKTDNKMKVVSNNNFPMGVGLSSSASGLAALSLAVSKAVGLNLSEKALSRLTRIGSGSACRSIPDGWVEWVKGKDDLSSYARQIFPVNYWDIRILIVILSEEEKKVASTEGHKLAESSKYFKDRLVWVERKLKEIKRAIGDKDFTSMGEIMEAEALNMHRVMKTSRPSLDYLLHGTYQVMDKITAWREEGLESYFTLNTGQSVIVFCEPEDEEELVEKLRGVEGVLEVRRDRIGKGARLI